MVLILCVFANVVWVSLYKLSMFKVLLKLNCCVVHCISFLGSLVSRYKSIWHKCVSYYIHSTPAGHGPAPDPWTAELAYQKRSPYWVRDPPVSAPKWPVFARKSGHPGLTELAYQKRSPYWVRGSFCSVSAPGRPVLAALRGRIHGFCRPLSHRIISQNGPKIR